MLIWVNLFVFISFVLIMSGFYMFIMHWKHLLNTLLSLEFIMLGIFFLLNSVMSSVGSESFFLFYFLILVVCEGVLGLSLLVSIVRAHGNDYFNSFSLLEC
uniref:NADH-ubiquinone oxidoreductase chain 4L n=1 Tax=Gastroptychus investigatoris TaxID=2020971 RepID=A0A3S6J3L3_9EUCA|nr:NADH dehydrogenase subunit 4L [Gastroptychus investigatoris]